MNNNIDKTTKIHTDGVFSSRKKDGTLYFRASITKKGKHISLGSYQTEELAGLAYKEAISLLEDSKINIISYNSKKNLLPFEKWVILINFRDNGIYFGKPIYVGQKLFYYYLSPKHILKFDMDDLFYYSSHKIMCRGNHYFVADYGMQVNIANRYGIKNYAVQGKDYLFKNGDSTDFRRENIEVWNTYNGVTLKQKNGQYYYEAKIHINGNYVIGKYKTEFEAAIAYNKAIDILIKNGIDKNFSPNYIDGLSPRSYADIYTGLQISPKILNYKERR